MSFKTKALGLAAATALSLSIVTGAMADGTTTVTLADTGAGCSASVTGAVDFGTYTWGSGSYSVQSGTTALSASVDVNDQTRAQAGCNFTVSAGTLNQNPVVAGNSIAGTAVHFTNNSVSDSFTGVATNPAFALTASIDLSSLNIAPGTYGGNITVTGVSAS